MANSDHTPVERYGLAAVGLFLVAQAVAAVIWGAKLETRVEVIETRGPPTSDGLAHRIVVMEERQRVIIEQLRLNTDKLDSLIDGLRSQIPTPSNRPTGR